MNCQKINSKLGDLLLDPDALSAEARLHVESCGECARELAELRSTMALLDDWAVPEANPFFDAKLLARIRSEQGVPAPGLLERWKTRLLYGSNLRMQPLLAGALGLAVLIGGGTYADLIWRAGRPVEESATVRDLQSLDGNAQVFQQLDSIDQSAQQPDQDAGQAAPSND
jgi:hypothetical protein